MAHEQTTYAQLYKPGARSDQISSQYMFIDNINQQEANHLSIIKRLGVSVSDVTALKAIDTSDTSLYTTGMLLLVSGIGIYQFDRSSTLTGDDVNIVVPSIGGGRWLNTAHTIMVSGADGLRAINTADTTVYPTGTLILVTNIGLFKLDRSSSAVDDGVNIIAPTDGVGRWLNTVQSSSNAIANMLVMRDANARAKIAAPLAITDIAQLATAMGIKWDLLQSYTEAGTYVWTAPDIYGDGRDYEIGVFIIGAGGSGGVSKQYSLSTSACSATGGGSGHTRSIIVTVTPGHEYTLVIGAGGAAVTVSTLNGTNRWAAGINGGSSSFDGMTVDGGTGGGKGMLNLQSGVDGGQGSDAANSTRTTTPCYGDDTYTIPSAVLRGGKSRPMECFNPFTMIKMLAAGGFAMSNTDASVTIQDAVTMEDGLISSAGVASATTSALVDSEAVTAIAPTSPGCGGGAASTGTCGPSSITPVSPATSGKGADGAVFIYVRRIPA